MSNLSSSIKMKRTKSSHHVSKIQSLPTDLLIEVLSRVASTSFTDFFNAKLSCRDFLEVSNDKLIMKNISVEKFPRVPWWEVKDEVSSFLKACRESGNPELLYRQGMRELFSEEKVESGEENLKRAAEMRHMEASYVYGIILLLRRSSSSSSRREEEEEEGMKLLNAVNKSRKLGECRERTRAFMLSMWLKANHQQFLSTSTSRKYTSFSCHDQSCGTSRGRSWDDEVKNRSYCQVCMCGDEVSFFCNLLIR